MPQSKFRVASFNVENLFARPKVFNFRDRSIGDALLKRIGDFRKILGKANYSAADKARLVQEFDQGDPANDKPPLKKFIKIREDRGSKLWKTQNRKIVGVKASGIGDCDLTIEFIKAKFSEIGRENTGKVIRTVKADVACIVEAEDRLSLKRFDTDLLSSRYRYEMLLDGNDQRGIDVGIYSRFPLGGIWTHMFDGTGRSKTFSRDCPEYEIKLPNGKSLFVLCNHLKSKGYDVSGTAGARRKKQAKAIADILKKYDLTRDWVIVAGDMNDTPDSGPLKPLMDVPDLYDVLALQFPGQPEKRWTYHYNSFDQIDYILVSKPLKGRFIQAGVERRGIYHLKKLTTSNPNIDDETEFDTVTHWTNAASDHAPVWADFDL
ncbi:endonuclease/exonuclease/phosphatase family protein [Gimesia panareensis]|uniref:endonuclease/exonuclease/phosphatase family protein n=1 Tax=Gimesia panareensis TaxID=2527978 RepID=UPI00118CE31F|nr:endonuclease/exonuclease/phosphatase family protein [Gimesia panareensis]QDU50163.1 Endonuclease/Exonuclease/phosphatase family protein [Gimesia panareensis]